MKTPFRSLAVFMLACTGLLLWPNAQAQVALSPNTYNGIATGVPNFTSVPAGACGGATFGNMNRGSGATSSTAANGFNSAGFSAASYSAADLGGDYVWFQVSAGTAPLTINSLQFILGRSGTGPTSLTFNYRMNSNADATPATQFSTTVDPGTSTSPGTTHTFNPPAAIVIPAGQSAYFRMVAWGGGTSGTIRIINGSAVIGSENCVTHTLTSPTLASSNFCVTGADGAAISLDYTVTGGTVNPGNDYNLQISTSPSFTSPVVVGTITNSAALTGTVSGTIPAGTAPGTYYVRITANDPVIDGSSQTLQVLPGISTSFTGSNVTCYGGTDAEIDITTTGGTGTLTYDWSNGETTEDLSNISLGLYTVYISDASGCTDTLAVSISQPAAISVGAGPINVLCAGDSTGGINLGASGGTGALSFEWSNGETTEDLSNLAAGVYTVIVTDANGCTDTMAVTVTEPAAITTSFTTTDALCNGDNTGGIDLTATGGMGTLGYEWSNGETTQDITNLAAGTYEVIITDAFGCDDTLNINVSEPAAIDAAVTGTDVQCFGQSNGSVNLTATGGTGTLTYDWSNGETTEDITGLAAGTYTVDITDDNGCTTSTSFTVAQPDTLEISSATITPATCATCPDGSILVAVTGGTPGFTTLWDNGDSDMLAQNLLPSATYCVTITDANGCAVSDCYPIGHLTGIAEAGAGNVDVKAYPNPSNGQDITFIIPATGNATTILTLYDVSGQPVITKTVNGSGEQTFILGTGSLSNGMYFYTLAGNNTALSTGKITISK